MTSPLTGAYTSEAALTDSTTAAAARFSGRAPCVGNSTNTRSASCSCAWSVIPTVPTSPSIRSHSWSSVNVNIAIDLRGSISVAFVAMRDERQIADPQRNAFSAYFAKNSFTGRRRVRVDVAHRNRRLHARSEAPGRDDANRARRNLVRVEFRAAAHRHAILDFQSDTAAWRAVRQLAQNDVCAGKSARARSTGAADFRDRPFERSHHRRRCWIEIGTVETQPSFQPQAVARAKADRHHRIVLA